MKALIMAALSGILSLIIGSLTVSNTFLYYIQQKSLGFDSNVSSGSLGRTGIVICELFMAVSFSILAILLLAIRKNYNIKKTSIVIGIVRLLLFLFMVIFYWSTAWYYILDPVGNFQFFYIMILLLALVQSSSFILIIKDKLLDK